MGTCYESVAASVFCLLSLFSLCLSRQRKGARDPEFTRRFPVLHVTSVSSIRGQQFKGGLRMLRWKNYAISPIWSLFISNRKPFAHHPSLRWLQCPASIASNVLDSLWGFSTTFRRRRDLLFQFRLQIFRRRVGIFSLFFLCCFYFLLKVHANSFFSFLHGLGLQ